MVAYIALAAAFFTYWFAREHCIAALKEFATMGIAAYFRQIKEEVIADGIAKGVAAAEAKAAKARDEARAKGISEGRAEGRELALNELRAMPRHEALALLECQDTDAEPPAPANGQSPPA